MSSELSPTALAALDAQYEILRELGRGGTALVYLARERSSGAEVAIKLIRSRYIDDEEALARFAREARFVAQLDHPNIVPVREVLDLGTAGIGLVMAHIAGRTLKQVIRADGRLTPARAEQVMRDIGGALGAAHAKGIVHRDVKPENIFIDGGGRALLADFGLARSTTADTQLTMTGVAIGTPAYMAPEQIEGDDLDARADVYSLGLVAWEMLAGHRPWDGESLYAILYHQKHDFLPDVRDLRDDVPDRLAEVIVRSIEKHRALRWRNMPELLGALDASTPPRVTPRRPPVSVDTTRFVRPVTPVTHETPIEPETVPSPPPRNISRRVRAAALLGAVVVVGFITAVVQGRSPEVSPRTPDRTTRPLGGDVAKPVTIGAPIARSRERGPTPSSRVDSLTTARRDTDLAGNDIAILTYRTAKKRVETTDTKSSTTATKSSTTDTKSSTKQAVSNGSADRNRATKRVETQPPLPASKPAPAPSIAPPPVAAPTPTPTRSPASAPLLSPPVLTPRVSVVAGGLHSCFIGADGRVFCWGNNDRGQVGNGTTTRASAPLLVGADARFAAIAVGLSHSCAIARGGAAWCWGNNEHGQLGDRSFGQRLAPVRTAGERVFRAITTGASHTCGLDVDGVAWCWGSNAHGELGDSSTRDRAAPVGAGMGATRFVRIDAGWNFTCALAANGHASCWGANSAGQLGDGTTSDRHGPVPVESNATFTSIATGSSHACGVTAQGEAYCWGRNTNGQLGDGTNIDRTTPVRVRGSAHFASITAGAVHTCAITDDGAAYCWGRNTYGQLGNGTNTDQSGPTSVLDGRIFASVRAFGSHTCGVTVAGEAFCWGYNLENQLGDGTRIHRTRPVRVETPSG